MDIHISRTDAGLWVNPTTAYINAFLRYSHRSFKSQNFKRVNHYEQKNLYSPDGGTGIFTLNGFFYRIIDLIEQHFDKAIVTDSRSTMPAINWQRVKDLKPRPYQQPAIVDFLTKGSQESGICKATGGYGKSYMQAMTYGAWDGLNTILAIPSQQVVMQTSEIFKKLFPEKHIGQVGAGAYDPSQDITISTFNSLRKCSLEKCDLLLVDEIQSSTGDMIQEIWPEISPKRVFGYTATDEGLFNGADKIITGLFGEKLLDISYQEAQDLGAVVPIVVYFVEMSDNILLASNSIEEKMMEGIDLLPARNQLVGAVCSMVPNKWQTIVFVDHIKTHLIEIMKYMPMDTRYLHRETNKKKIGAYAMTKKMQDKTVAEYGNNEFQFLIATDAFRAGVDIPNCRVMVQAAGGSSTIEVTQEALRASRALKEEHRIKFGVEPKTHSVIVDFWDAHDSFLLTQSEKRRDTYAKLGWKIKRVKSPDEIDWTYDGNFKTLDL